MKIANSLSLLLGLVLGMISLQWILSPQIAAETLNMIYLDGQGRNTQIRDFTAFFLGTSTMCFISFFTKQYQWIFSTGIIYMLAGLFNILASINYDADIAISSLIAEILFTVIAWTSAFFYKLNSL